MRKCVWSVAVLVVLTLGSVAHAAPIQLISNGGFETGNFSGWTVTAGTPLGLGWSINNGSFVPPGPRGALAPISGNFDAVSLQTGGNNGNLLVSQTFVVPTTVVDAVLSWSDRIHNYGGAFVDPTQEFRVLLEDSSGNLIQEIYSTNPGDPLIQSGPNNRSFNITALLQGYLGQTLRVSFEQQDNLGFFNATVDNVSLLVTTPEPATLAVFGLMAAGGLGYVRRRTKAVAAPVA